MYSVNTTNINCFIFWLHGVNEIFQVPVRIRVSIVAVRAKTLHFLAFASVLIARHWCVLSSYPANELVSSYLQLSVRWESSTRERTHLPLPGIPVSVSEGSGLCLLMSGLGQEKWSSFFFINVCKSAKIMLRNGNYVFESFCTLEKCHVFRLRIYDSWGIYDPLYKLSLPYLPLVQNWIIPFPMSLLSRLKMRKAS